MKGWSEESLSPGLSDALHEIEPSCCMCGKSKNCKGEKGRTFLRGDKRGRKVVMKDAGRHFGDCL